MPGSVEFGKTGLDEIGATDFVQVQAGGGPEREIIPNAEAVPDLWIGVALLVGGAIWIAKNMLSHKKQL